MKKGKSFGLLLLGMFLLFACNKNEDDEPVKPPKPEDNMLAENTKVITSEQAQMAQVTFNESNQTVVVKNPSALDKPIEKGDILVSGENGGYLRKVTTVTINGNEVVASTEQATLEDAFTHLKLRINVPVEQKSVATKSGGNANSTVYYQAKRLENGEYVVTAEDKITTRAGVGVSKENTIIDKDFKVELDEQGLISASGNLNLKTILNAEVDIDYKIQKCDFSFAIEEGLEVGFLVTTPKYKLSKEKELVGIEFKDITVFIGNVPVVVRPEIELFAGFILNAEGNIEQKIEQKYTYKVGLRYDDGNWVGYKENKNSFDVGYPNLTAKASADVYVKPKLKLRFYRVVAPKLIVKIGTKANVVATVNPINGFDWDWWVEGYLNARLGLDAKVLGKTVVDYEPKEPLIEYRKKLLSAKDFASNRPPQEPSLTEPSNQFTTEQTTVNFAWECQDPNEDALVYTFYYAKDEKKNWKKIENLTTNAYQLANLEYGTYYWRVKATEKDTKEKLATFSNEYSFIVNRPNTPPTKPVLLKPTNNGTLDVNEPILEWKESTDAEGDKITYTVFLSEPNGDELDIITNNHNDNSLDIAYLVLKHGMYKWKVVATDGKATAESDIFTFKVKKAVRDLVILDKDKTISLKKDETKQINIVDGNGTYTLKSSDDNIASATEKDEVITVTGKAKGIATLTLTDTETNQTQEITVTVTDNGTYPEDQKVFVKGGTFDMGSNNGASNEKPVHSVTVSDFYIGKYEVTNAQYAAFLNEKGNQREGGKSWLDIDSYYCQIEQVNGVFKAKEGKENYPVIEVTWYGARAYAKWVGGRLPSEAEWEYAARGGNKSNGYKYSGSNNIDDVAWHGSNSGGHTHTVGTKQANELGIYDMSGNVWELCEDTWHYNYNGAPTDGTAWVDDRHSQRVFRSGSCFYYAKTCRVAKRGLDYPNSSGNNNGFRVVFLP